MMLSEATVKELKKILKKDYGKEVTSAEASEIAHTLVSYFDLLAKIYHQIKTQNNDNDENTNN